MSFAKAFVTGTVVKAPEKRFTQNDMAIAGFSLNIDSQRLCIIPTDSKDEVLAYEFKGNIDDKEFLVYINANTLQEEKIYILLNTPGGTMAI